MPDQDLHAAVRALGSAPGIEVLDIVCTAAPTGFVSPQLSRGLRLGLARSGGYLLRRRGEEEFVDATVGFLTWPGTELSVAHPRGVHDRGTMVRLDLDTFGDLLDAVPTRCFPTSSQLDLRHRALAAACARGIDEFQLTEQLHDLLAHLPPPAGAQSSARPATVVAHHRLISEVRELIAAGEFALSLEAIAARLGSSPHHLSRVFRRRTGHSITWYRNEMRIRAVCEDIAAGHTSLRTLAALYGFVDQAHLARVMRRHVGSPPHAVRASLLPAK